MYVEINSVELAVSRKENDAYISEISTNITDTMREIALYRSLIIGYCSCVLQV